MADQLKQLDVLCDMLVDLPDPPRMPLPQRQHVEDLRKLIALSESKGVPFVDSWHGACARLAQFGLPGLMTMADLIPTLPNVAAMVLQPVQNNGKIGEGSFMFYNSECFPDARIGIDSKAMFIVHELGHVLTPHAIVCDRTVDEPTHRRTMESIAYGVQWLVCGAVWEYEPQTVLRLCARGLHRYGATPQDIQQQATVIGAITGEILACLEQ